MTIVVKLFVGAARWLGTALSNCSEYLGTSYHGDECEEVNGTHNILLFMPKG